MTEQFYDNHAPDLPFGCCVAFGPPLGGAFPADMLVHICNSDAPHEGPHACKCGATEKGEGNDV